MRSRSTARVLHPASRGLPPHERQKLAEAPGHVDELLLLLRLEPLGWRKADPPGSSGTSCSGLGARIPALDLLEGIFELTEPGSEGFQQLPEVPDRRGVAPSFVLRDLSFVEAGPARDLVLGEVPPVAKPPKGASKTVERTHPATLAGVRHGEATVPSAPVRRSWPHQWGRQTLTPAPLT